MSSIFHNLFRQTSRIFPEISGSKLQLQATMKQRRWVAIKRLETASHKIALFLYDIQLYGNRVS